MKKIMPFILLLLSFQTFADVGLKCKFQKGDWSENRSPVKSSFKAECRSGDGNMYTIKVKDKGLLVTQLFSDFWEGRSSVISDFFIICPLVRKNKIEGTYRGVYVSVGMIGQLKPSIMMNKRGGACFFLQAEIGGITADLTYSTMKIEKSMAGLEYDKVEVIE